MGIASGKSNKRRVLPVGYIPRQHARQKLLYLRYNRLRVINVSKSDGENIKNHDITGGDFLQ